MATDKDKNKSQDLKLSNLEQELIQHLSTKKEVEQKVNGGFRRVKGLSLKLDFRNAKKPLILVEIGMCEAAFDAVTGYKEKGSCFGIERLIVDWLQRPSIRAQIDMYLQQSRR